MLSGQSSRAVERALKEREREREGVMARVLKERGSRPRTKGERVMVRVLKEREGHGRVLKERGSWSVY